MQKPSAAFVVAALVTSAALLLAACSTSNRQASQTATATPTAVGQSSQSGLGSLGASLGSGEGEGGGERGGGGGGEGEGGEGASAAQHVSLTITDSGIQPASLTARAGLVILDFANHGQNAHQVSIQGTNISGTTATDVGPDQSVSLQANLSPGSYRLVLDPNASPPPGIVATLQVQ